MSQVSVYFRTSLSRLSTAVPVISQSCKNAQKIRLYSANKLQPPMCSSHLPLTGRSTQCQQSRKITPDRTTTAVTLWRDLNQIRSSPLPALVFGFSGLIPFVSVPSYMISMQVYIPELVFAQTAYGACILSFLGGIRWGFVIPENSSLKADWLNLGYSVIPSLVAWVGLLLPSPFSTVVVMTGIAGAAYFDATVKDYPPWFKGLRFVLSIGAVLSLWSAFLCQYVLKNRSGKASNTKEIDKGENSSEETKPK